tara:strand:- start:1319 stop:1492 length:174 start_codon:yes stop_codon:yes gene_type:complete
MSKQEQEKLQIETAELLIELTKKVEIQGKTIDNLSDLSVKLTDVVKLLDEKINNLTK